MKKLLGAAVAFTMAVVGTTVHAATVFTSGAGSAVTLVDASADFENINALSNNYAEDGILFAKSSNSCGFAGVSCPTHNGFFSGPTPLSGNFLYNTDVGQIEATSGNVFKGLELILGNGHNANSWSFLLDWSSYLNGNLVSSGTTGPLGFPAIYGWSDATGFDKLVFSDLGCCLAFDKVSVQYSVSAVPLPAAFPLFGTGLAVLGFLGWRRRRQAQAV